jgi:hypothetical protein
MCIRDSRDCVFSQNFALRLNKLEVLDA